MATRVTDMSVDELKVLIQETVKVAFTELFSDPDEGLELRDDLENALQLSLGNVNAREETLAVESASAKLGLIW